MARTNTQPSAIAVPAVRPQEAFQEVQASFDRFCLISGNAALEEMLEEDANDPPRPYPGNERRELSSQPKPKTAEIPKTASLTAEAKVDSVGPQGRRIRRPHAASLRVTQSATQEAARFPPMDYRDNPQHRGRHHIKWTSFKPPFGPILLRR